MSARTSWYIYVPLAAFVDKTRYGKGALWAAARNKFALHLIERPHHEKAIRLKMKELGVPDHIADAIIKAKGKNVRNIIGPDPYFEARDQRAQNLKKPGNFGPKPEQRRPQKREVYRNWPYRHPTPAEGQRILSRREQPWVYKTWTDEDNHDLRFLTKISASVKTAELILGREPKTLAWRAKETGLTLPSDWRALIMPPSGDGRAALIKLAYPFVIRPRDEHADLLAVNALVPRIPGREDVCQEIMLAIFEGRTTIEALRKSTTSVRSFITYFHRLNYEASGYATSMDAIVPGTDGLRLRDTFAESDSL